MKVLSLVGAGCSGNNIEFAPGLQHRSAILAGVAMPEVNMTTIREAEDSGVTMPKVTLGRSGLEVSVIGWGSGGAFSRPDELEPIWEEASGLGLNFIDTAPSYGTSEDLIGDQLSQRRSEFVLTTKSHPVDADTTLREIETSLQRLKTDYVDLFYTPHGVGSEEQLASCFGKGGVMEGALKAKERGLVKHLGYSLDYFNSPFNPGRTRELIDTDIYDVVQLPYNLVPMEPVDEELIPFAREKGMGVVANFPSIQGLTALEWGIFYPTFKGLVDTPGQATFLGILCNPGIDVVLTQLVNVDRARENCLAGVLHGMMSEGERAQLREEIVSKGPVRFLDRADVPEPWHGVNLRRFLIHLELYTRFGYGGSRREVEVFATQLRDHPEWRFDNSLRDLIDEIRRGFPVLP
jgi:diketogulonate reductase-like aldo/keto reductase